MTRDPEITPDEIFLDSANLASFDRGRFEGRLERPLENSSFKLIMIGLTLLFIILVAQSWNLEIREGTAYAAESIKNSLGEEMIFPERGQILDENGVVLAGNTTDADGSVHRTYLTPGFGLLLGYVSYPKKDASGNYYDTSETGMAGVEAEFNSELAGKEGTILVEKDAAGNVQSQGAIIPPENGKDVTLTIDARAQKAFYDSISALAKRIPFSGGAGILMDANTGAVRALVSFPEYDPTVLSEGKPADVIASYNDDPNKPYLNRPVAGLYTPGSIVKPIEAAGALTDHIITPDFTIDDQGFISIPNPYDPAHPNIFKDWKALGVEDLRRAIAFSSDVYFYTVGGGYGAQKGLGIDGIEKWFSTFGLASTTGIQLPGEQSGFIPTPEWKQQTFNEAWNIGDTYHTAIGQYAVQVTPLEMARTVAAVANGGLLVTPTLVPGGQPTGETLPVDPSTFEVIREGMRRGVTEGTSVQLYPLDSFLHAAGKTGTAQTGTHNQFYNSWAEGFFPYTDPKYVYVVMMDQGPAGNIDGAAYALAQIFTELHQTAPDYFQ